MLQHGRIIVSDAFYRTPYCMLLYTKKEKMGAAAEAGMPFFLMRTIPILIVWRLFRFFVINLQSARSCICACVVFAVGHMYRESHSRHAGSYSQKREEKKKKKKRLIRCLASREPPQRSAGLAAFGPLLARWSLFALAAPVS